ncbi:hypothetical protein [Leptolyngbya sp. FACHB-16]|uniref:hypothetical protein n=1 Tax=unclassified Leptolyngbya TaxID=2650499 RepID=UPI001686EC6A|nr:hypothetical protein [Leptolyngbya sp. FACHB-16]MBD2156821.1 hypothetical protein [Leptolyngbya sp. FACHB-16]
MKLPPECWCFARFAGKAPTFWVNSYAETSLGRAPSTTPFIYTAQHSSDLKRWEKHKTRCFGKHRVSSSWQLCLDQGIIPH